MTQIRHGLATATLALLATTLSPAALATTTSSSSTSASASGPGGQPPGPPPEAIAACKGKAIGTVASFTDRGGRTISGPCTQIGDVVAVAPPAHGPGNHNGPPPGQQGQQQGQ